MTRVATLFARDVVCKFVCELGRFTMQLLIRVVAAAAVLSLAGTATKALPPAEAFGSLPLAQPQLSPDGRHFAVIQDVAGRPAVEIYTVNTKNPPAIVGDSRDLIAGFVWAKNDRLLIKINTNTKIGGDRFVRAYFQALTVDAEGDHPTLMFGDTVWSGMNMSTSAVADLDNGDPTHILMPLIVPNGVTLYRVDVTTGKAEPLLHGDPYTMQFITDGTGHVVARVRALGDTDAQLDYRDGEHWKAVGQYDLSSGRGSSIIGLNEKGDGIVRYAEDDKTKTDGLTLIDPATGKESPLYGNDRYDVADILTDVRTDRVIGVSYVDDRTQYHYFDPAWQNLQSGLEAAFPGKSVYAASWNDGKDKLIIDVEDPGKPKTYYFLDRTTHQAMQIVSAYPHLTDADLGEVKPWPYKARDGLDIPAYLTLPPGKAAKNLPVVILPHGGPSARDAMGFDWMAQFFANRGYAVLQPNFRGSTGYGEKFESAGYGQWGLKMQDDVTDGVKKLIADGVADPKRICIVGASYGGYAALAGAAFTPDLYACAVSFAGVSDLFLLWRDGVALRGNRHYGLGWTKSVGDRFDDADKLEATSPARHADQIKCPVLLMHGADDSTVRIDQSEAMRDALQKAGKEVQFIKFDGDSHYMQLADTRIRFLKETEAFLQKNIGN